jgi:hypothetical protein
VAFERRNLEAILVIEVHAQCHPREFVLPMEVASEPSGKIAHLIADADQCGDAGARAADFNGRLLQSGLNKVADCLRPIGVPARALEATDLRDKIIVNAMVTRRTGPSWW